MLLAAGGEAHHQLAAEGRGRRLDAGDDRGVEGLAGELARVPGQNQADVSAEPATQSLRPGVRCPADLPGMGDDLRAQPLRDAGLPLSA